MGAFLSTLNEPLRRRLRHQTNQLPSSADLPEPNLLQTRSPREATGRSGHQTRASSPSAPDRPPPESNPGGPDSRAPHAAYSWPDTRGLQSARLGGESRYEDAPRVRTYPEVHASSTTGYGGHSLETNSVFLSEDSTISLLKELISLNKAPTPATAQLIGLHQALGQAATNMTRNKHRMYLILARSREICNYILDTLESPADSDESEVQPEAILQAMELSYTLIDTLEAYVSLKPLIRTADSCYRVLLEVAEVMPAELEVLGRTSLLSWPRSGEHLLKIWNQLEGAPFDVSRRHILWFSANY